MAVIMAEDVLDTPLDVVPPRKLLIDLLCLPISSLDLQRLGPRCVLRHLPLGTWGSVYNYPLM